MSDKTPNTLPTRVRTRVLDEQRFVATLRFVCVVPTNGPKLVAARYGGEVVLAAWVVFGLKISSGCQTF